MKFTSVWATLAFVLLTSAADQSSGYLTGAPVVDWIGLATASGRDAIVLGDGCDKAAPGVNVVILNAAQVQVVDPLLGVQPGACTVAQRIHMSDVPCATNAQGLCDVAFE